MDVSENVEPPLTDAYEVLRRYFGYETFRGPQLQIINRVRQGGHALVIMPTGMGKSLCYQIPALMPAATPQAKDDRPGLTLVLSPLIALMKDQVDALRQRGVDAAYINSSLQRSQREQRYDQVQQGKFALLYVTPERFRKPEFLEVVGKREVQLLAVDEAHCISEWGHDFRPDYTRLAEIRTQLEYPTTIALTATATPEVQSDIVRQLGLQSDEVELFHEGIARPNLQLSVEDVWGVDEKLEQIQAIRERFDADSGQSSGIVYFTLIKTLDEFSERLRQQGVSHLVYHGQLERRARQSVQDEFMNNPGHLVLATNAFGMGIDKEDIRFVIHADVPGSMESYYQEIGRAGRDGRASECCLLYDERDLVTQMEFLRWSNPDAEYYRQIWDLLRHEQQQWQAFGMDWLRQKLHHKDKHDFRFDTALAILERWGMIEGSVRTLDIEVVGDELPEALTDPERLSAKLLRDQKKLYALVQYVNHDGDRKAFIHQYFGLPYEDADS